MATECHLSETFKDSCIITTKSESDNCEKQDKENKTQTEKDEVKEIEDGLENEEETLCFECGSVYVTEPHICFCGDGSSDDIDREEDVEEEFDLLICDYCLESFGDIRTLAYHLNEHLRMDPVFKCPYCDEKFGSAWMFKDHKDSVHGDEKPKPEDELNLCDVCGTVDDNSSEHFCTELPTCVK